MGAPDSVAELERASHYAPTVLPLPLAEWPILRASMCVCFNRLKRLQSGERENVVTETLLSGNYYG
jgi:hypothetical protein